jgi:hypothetical protein
VLYNIQHQTHFTGGYQTCGVGRADELLRELLEDSDTGLLIDVEEGTKEGPDSCWAADWETTEPICVFICRAGYLMRYTTH